MSRNSSEANQKSGLSRSWLDSWHVSASLNKDYDVIDGLRGMAILLVVAYHLLYYNREASLPIRLVGGTIGWGGNYGVRVFFALSGFLISLPFWRLKSRDIAQVIPHGYAIRRFWKIYPPLAFSLLLLVPVYILKSGDVSYINIALKWLIGLPWVWPIEGKLNPVMWSLIVEVHFYATLPLLFLATRKLSYKTTMATIFAFLVIVPFIFRWWCTSQGKSVDLTLSPMILTHFPSNLDAFALGVLLGGFETAKMISKRLAPLGNIGLFLLFAAMCLSSAVDHLHLNHPLLSRESLSALVKISAGLMILFIANPKHFSTRLLSFSLLRWIGIISYEWYLFHQPIFRWVKKAFGGSSDGNVILYLQIVGTSAIISLIIAALVYRYFSLPILRWGRARPTSKA